MKITISSPGLHQLMWLYRSLNTFIKMVALKDGYAPIVLHKEQVDVKRINVVITHKSAGLNAKDVAKIQLCKRCIV